MLCLMSAVQRATIVVHEEKVLVKTEIVKAIITPDKAVLIKGRCEWAAAQGGLGSEHCLLKYNGHTWAFIENVQAIKKRKGTC